MFQRKHLPTKLIFLKTGGVRLTDIAQQLDEETEVRSEEELNDMMEQVPFNDWFSNTNPISLHDLESCKCRHKRPKPLVLIENVFPKLVGLSTFHRFTQKVYDGFWKSLHVGSGGFQKLCSDCIGNFQ